jgi:MFS family permease
LLRKDLRAIKAEGAASSLMVGMGETYFPAFVLAISHSQLACGLSATVPLLVGALAQLLTPFALRRIRSYRRWVVGCAVAQAMAFLPLVAAALLGQLPVAAAFALLAVYWAAGLAGHGPWNILIDTLVPERLRARYFAYRTLVCQVAMAAGLVAGGIALQVGAQGGWPLAAFAMVFAAAAASRFISAGLLSRHSETDYPRVEQPTPQLGALWRMVRTHVAGRTLAYLLAAQVAVQVSGPYFTPYMLGQLELSYGSYVVLLCVMYLAKIISLPWLGQIAERFGPCRLLWVGGVAIVPLSALWLFSDKFLYLCGIQLLSGIAWGAYELAMLLMFFAAIPRQRRVAVLTAYNALNALAIVTGSLVGGAVLAGFAAAREAYLGIFAASSLLRAAALVLLARIPAGEAPAARSLVLPVATLSNTPTLSATGQDRRDLQAA